MMMMMMMMMMKAIGKMWRASIDEKDGSLLIGPP